MKRSSVKATCKKCRELGEKLFLKVDKCNGGKCPVDKRTVGLKQLRKNR